MHAKMWYFLRQYAKIIATSKVLFPLLSSLLFVSWERKILQHIDTRKVDDQEKIHEKSESLLYTYIYATPHV